VVVNMLRKYTRENRDLELLLFDEQLQRLAE
jgi:hypothetical protein